MRQFDNPALSAFVSQFDDELVLAQVLIRRTGTAWELRNVADRDCASAALREVTAESLRELVQFDARRAFRPLKSAPDLVGGWRCTAGNAESLGEALNRIYPGVLADWFAARQSPAPVTDYREFTERQSGMYRVTTMLDDAQAGRVIRAACHGEFCLKQRLWSVPGLPADTVAEKSLIPCLEPCAVLLEFARKSARIEQEEKITALLSPSEANDLKVAVENAIRTGKPNGESAPPTTDERRRWRLIGEKLALLSKVPEPSH